FCSLAGAEILGDGPAPFEECTGRGEVPAFPPHVAEHQGPRGPQARNAEFLGESESLRQVCGRLLEIAPLPRYGTELAQGCPDAFRVFTIAEELVGRVARTSALARSPRTSATRASLI